MKIKQNEDGSGEIHFSNEEIDIINKNKKLVLTTLFLKHFINIFMSLFFEYQKKFDKKTQTMQSSLNQEIECKKSKE